MISSSWTLRSATPSDFDGLGQLMFNCVRTGDSPYTEAQRQAWVPAPRTGPDWAERLTGQFIILAESATGATGFMSLVESAGYIDFAYVLPQARGQGLFRKLYQQIETRARDAETERLQVHASLMAEPAFGAMGFKIVTPEEVPIGDQRLKRFLMEKTLS